jgi:hypothetical protein
MRHYTSGEQRSDRIGLTVPLEPIESYANQAAGATVNQRTLPVLILVFSKVTKEAGVWDIAQATEHANIGSRFAKVFREVHVVRIYEYKIRILLSFIYLYFDPPHTFQTVILKRRFTQHKSQPSKH